MGFAAGAISGPALASGGASALGSTVVPGVGTLALGSIAAAPATGGASLLANPVVQQVLAMLGGQMIGSLFGGGQTPFEQSTAQGLAARTQLMGQLQAQAAGQPTAATRAQSRQLSAQINRLQQSYAASAQRGGTAGTTPARAQQGRLQAAKVEGLANIMGQSQINAQQQLGQLVGAAPQQQYLAEVQRRQARKEFLGGIGQIITEARMQESEGLMDAETKQAIQMLMDFVKSLRGSLVTGT